MCNLLIQTENTCFPECNLGHVTNALIKCANKRESRKRSPDASMRSESVLYKFCVIFWLSPVL